MALQEYADYDAMGLAELVRQMLFRLSVCDVVCIDSPFINLAS